MRRLGKGSSLFTLLLAGAVIVGCARQNDDDALTTLDSTLAMDSSLIAGTDVPEPGLTPSEQYQDPTPATRSPSRPRTPSTKTPSPSPTPSQPSTPRTSTVTVPAGTNVALTLDQTLTTKSTRAGEEFTATVANDVIVNGVVAIPAGSTVHGHVVLAQRSGKASGRAYMQLAFDNVEIGDRTYNIASVNDTVFGKGGGSKDAALIGGGAVAGAVIGGILGGGAGDAAKGAVIGGAAGTGASLLTRGPDLELKAGQTVSVNLDRSVTVTRSRTSA